MKGTRWLVPAEVAVRQVEAGEEGGAAQARHDATNRGALQHIFCF
jgi:hypothetical protein